MCLQLLERGSRQKDGNSSKADSEPVHGEVHLVAQPVGRARLSVKLHKLCCLLIIIKLIALIAFITRTIKQIAHFIHSVLLQ